MITMNKNMQNKICEKCKCTRVVLFRIGVLTREEIQRRIDSYYTR